MAGTREIKYWVLGWGSNACVLEPESMRQELLAEARAMAGLYEAEDEASTPVSHHKGGQSETSLSGTGS